MEGPYFHFGEQRSMDPAYNDLQVFANSLNVKRVREGRRARVDEDVRRLSHSRRGRGDSKQSMRNSSLVNVERHVTIASAGMYPESGIS
jgi:hypothetical protein